MDRKGRIEDLSDFIKTYFDEISDYINKYQNKNVLAVFITRFAREMGLYVTKNKDFCFIRSGEKPKILLNLNISSFDKKSPKFNTLIDKDESKKKYSFYHINEISEILVILAIISYCSNDFEILISFSNEPSINFDNFDFSIVKSKNIINLDLDTDEFIADSSAAGHIVNVYIPFERIFAKENSIDFRLSVTRLLGGHSGSDIDKMRQNSIKLILQILRRLKSHVDLDIIDINGGLKLNTIPNQSYIDISVKKEYKNDIIEAFRIVSEEQNQRTLKTEPDVNFEINCLNRSSDKVINIDDFDMINSFIELTPSGVYSTDDITKEIESSINLSRISTYRNFAKISMFIRSFSNEKLNEIFEKIQIASTIAKGNVEKIIEYPMWKKDSENRLAQIIIDNYLKIYDKSINIKTAQEALICGIFKQKIKNSSIVSMGLKYEKNEKEYSMDIEDIIKQFSLLKLILNNQQMGII
ncbi:MAG: hypothetical protein Q4B52_01920 [Tissierellia bacterium]|nr:hypothetical protein [Tissierellia bacterium]